MRPQLLSEFWQDRHVAALSAFGFGNQDHLFFKEHVLHFDIYKLRDPRTGLKERLDEQSPLPFHPVRVFDEAFFFLTREPSYDPLAYLRSLDPERAPNLLDDIVHLI